MIENELFTCSRCRQSLTRDMFRLNKDSKSGLNSWCNNCFNDYNRKQYHLNPERHRKYDRDYWNTHKEEINHRRRRNRPMRKDILNARMRQWRRTFDYKEWKKQYKQTEQYKLSEWKQGLKKHYGMTPEQYLHLLEQQGYVCAICKHSERNNRRLAVDHDHKTGEIRGLLCTLCNFGIGYFRNNTRLLSRAIEYLQQLNLNF